MRIVHRSRLLVWIKSCCYVERYSPLDLFEPARGVIRIPQQMTLQQKRGSKRKKNIPLAGTLLEQEDARRRLPGVSWCKKELPVCSMAMESWVVYITDVCRRDGNLLLRTNTLEDELHTRVPLMLKTKLTSILPPYMLGPVQTSNFACTELNARVKCSWSATFESIKFDCLN